MLVTIISFLIRCHGNSFIKSTSRLALCCKNNRNKNKRSKKMPLPLFIAIGAGAAAVAGVAAGVRWCRKNEGRQKIPSSLANRCHKRNIKKLLASRS
jgi:hypothetical protein